MRTSTSLTLLLIFLSLLVPLTASGRDDSQVAAISIDEMARLAPAALKLGERLVYEGSLAQGDNFLHVGHAELRTESDASGGATLKARARGARLGYILDNRLTTVLDHQGLPILHRNEQQGTERRHKKIEFSNGGARFARLKHCNSSGCENSKHMIDAVNFVGFIPWGTKAVHCEEESCTHRDHYAWQYQKDHQFEGPYFDLLSAVFVARGLEFEVGDDPQTIAVVSDNELWLVDVFAQKSEVLKVKAGEFDSLCLVLEPRPAPGSDGKARFEGLFGLKGSLRIWVEKNTGRPVLIEGDLPFAFLDFKARIELSKIQELPSATIAPTAATASQNEKAGAAVSGATNPTAGIDPSTGKVAKGEVKASGEEKSDEEEEDDCDGRR